MEILAPEPPVSGAPSTDSATRRFRRLTPLTKMSLAKNQKGFSLVELTIVVVILGVLSMLAVPRYQTAVERSKASESFAYLAQIEAGQARYAARHGQYCKKVTDLDMDIDAPEHFKVGNFTSSNWETKWECKLTRSGAASGFGAYTVVWDQEGFNAKRSSIKDDLIPVK